MNKSKKIVVGILSAAILIAVSAGVYFSINNSPEKEQNVTVIQADYPQYDNAQSLVDHADWVFTGTVTGVSYKMLNIKSENGKDSMTGLEESEALPYTIFEIEVEHIYKGDIEDSPVSVKQPGGSFDDTKYIIESAAAIEIGQTYLFTADTFDNSYPSLLNANQSVYNINTETYASGNNDILLSDILALFE